jgi:hypothetical protein
MRRAVKTAKAVREAGIECPVNIDPTSLMIRNAQEYLLIVAHRQSERERTLSGAQKMWTRMTGKK